MTVSLSNPASPCLRITALHHWFSWLFLTVFITGNPSGIEYIQAQTDTPASSATLDSSFVNLVSVGDIMLGHRLIPFMKTYGSDYPFRKIAPVVRKADIALGNLEAPFTKTGEPYPKTYTFRVPPLFAKGLSFCGIDIVTLANNHIMDYGEAGLFSTMSVLDQLKIPYIGAGKNIQDSTKPVFMNVRGTIIGFLGYSMTYPDEFYATPDSAGTAYPYEMDKQIERCAKNSDVTVVTFHWGGEHLEYPKDYQVVYAQRAIDNGADLVVGHHPHSIQGVEKYKSGLIAYSLGNFAFGTYSPNVKYGILLKTAFLDGNFYCAELVPLLVNNFEVCFQPEIIKEKHRSEFIRYIQKISWELNHEKNVINTIGIIMN